MAISDVMSLPILLIRLAINNGRKLLPLLLVVIILILLLKDILLCSTNAVSVSKQEVSSIGCREDPGICDDNRPIVWLVTGEQDVSDTEMAYDIREGHHLEHRGAALVEHGYKISSNPDSDWDFVTGGRSIYRKLLPKQLKPHQKLTMIPGHAVISNKRNLYGKHYPFMSQSFQLPNEKGLFLKYAAKYPDTQWVLKVVKHRGTGVQFKTVNEIREFKGNGAVQEFISNPLLIDGRKMDVAIYTAVTSVNPLRIYINQADWYFRFCLEPYHPFDPNNINKYVIQTANYKVTWEMPSLMPFYDNYTMSHKETLFAYLRQKGYPTHKIDRLEDRMIKLIQSVYVNAEPEIIAEGKESWEQFGSIRNFFELMRCDFLIDDNLDPHLIEVGEGPATSSRLRPRRREQFRRLYYSLYNLVGLASYRKQDPWERNVLEREMQVVERDLTTDGAACMKNNCLRKCGEQVCDLCAPCLNIEDKMTLANAFMEHTNKYDWKRIMPMPFQSQGIAKLWNPEEDDLYVKMTQRTKWMTRWFHRKCLQNPDWCN